MSRRLARERAAAHGGDTSPGGGMGAASTLIRSTGGAPPFAEPSSPEERDGADANTPVVIRGAGRAGDRWLEGLLRSSTRTAHRPGKLMARLGFVTLTGVATLARRGQAREDRGNL